MSDEGELFQELRRLSRLVSLVSIRGMRQPEAIELLSGAGFANVDIASMVGTTPDTVRASLSKSRRAKQVTRKRTKASRTDEAEVST